MSSLLNRHKIVCMASSSSSSSVAAVSGASPATAPLPVATNLPTLDETLAVAQRLHDMRLVLVDAPRAARGHVLRLGVLVDDLMLHLRRDPIAAAITAAEEAAGR
jgi:hypothetical protein